MKYIIPLLQLIPIYAFYLAGEWLQLFFDLPLPGSIIGFLLLFVALLLKIYPLQWIESGSRLILAFLPLFFIPATVGVMDYGELFAGKGMWLIVIVIVSTLLAMGASGWTSQYISRFTDKKEDH
ncbi:CidA/LrgA family protein [Planococcus salinus]|uniref:CidA/LrgA family holin-like protein n=1 Tax=Planococcus salinus TaxID=1848460 RepID=A0A3M8P4Z0_9BACL|nr:CidA/LrgA family holin-like protein [Planococcus salinus]RNF38729.1 CidA/LrgA family holin-like protein [Planococcus salinus]